ncbi:MAG: carbamoyl phosphate synthase small subunit, partial [Dolichospermum sp.]
IPGIYGIDTRSLTRKIRMCGAMNGGISTAILDETELLEMVQAAPNMTGLNLVKKVTTKAVYEWQETTTAPWEFNPEAVAKISETYTVVALDFGIK